MLNQLSYSRSMLGRLLSASCEHGPRLCMWGLEGVSVLPGFGFDIGRPTRLGRAAA